MGLQEVRTSSFDLPRAQEGSVLGEGRAITLFSEIIVLFLVSPIAISLFPFLSSPVSRALANLNLRVLRFLNSSFYLCLFLQTARCW